MENIDEQLRINIRSILNPVSEETVNDIIQAIKYAGLVSLSDLKFVQDEDLILVLKPIQRRKLIKAWSGEQRRNCETQKNLEENINSSSEVSSATSVSRLATTVPVTNPTSTVIATHSNDRKCLEDCEMENYEMEQNLEEDNLNSSSEVFSRVTVTVPVANRTATSISTYSNGSCKRKILDDCEIATPLAKKSNTIPFQMCKWTRKNCLTLLQVYRKHKHKLISSDVNFPNVWKIIAEEVGAETSLNCDEFQCRKKIVLLRCELERIQKQFITDEPLSEIIYRSILRRAFKNSKKSDSLSVQECGWSKADDFLLLQAYSRYKTEILSPDVEHNACWSKIVNEIKRKSRVDCNEFHCRNEINELRREYERIKNKVVTSAAMAHFLDKARLAFETTNCPDQQSSSVKLRHSGKGNKKYCRTLLQVYTKYKTEFSSPDIEEKSVWEKIARAMREDFLYDCGESFCRFVLLRLKTQYRDLKYSGIQSNIMDYLFDEAQMAFEMDDNRDSSSSQEDASKKVVKYVPPHLRNDQNKKSETITSSNNIDENCTIRVSNLSERVTEADLQELFKRFGPIARIYRSENKPSLCKDVAFVQFTKQEDAIQAIQVIDGHEYDKLILNVELA